MGFFIYKGADTKRKLWYLPAVGIFLLGKYLGDRDKNEKLRECELEEYLVKSTLFKNQLKYMELEIENYDRL
jgi:hypothetical protein